MNPAIATTSSDDKNVMILMIPTNASRRLAEKCKYIVVAAFISCALTMPPVYGSPWIKVNTQHFSIYSTYPPERSTQLATLAEEARAFVTQATDIPDVSFVRNLVVVASRNDYRRLTGSDTTIGTYLTDSSGREYLVFTWLGAESRNNLIHELARSALIKMYPRLPWCLTQGLADVLASARWHNNTVRFGGENIALATAAWIDDDDSIKLRDLLQVDDSVLNTINYATFRTIAGESWMFAHMLLMSEAYSEQFPIFLDQVQNGSSVPNSLTTVYRKSMDRIETDFRRYANAMSYRRVTVKRPAAGAQQRFTAYIMTDSDVYALEKRMHAVIMTTRHIAQERMLISASDIVDTPTHESVASMYHSMSDKTLRRR
jgi:hypothetical protein